MAGSCHFSDRPISRFRKYFDDWEFHKSKIEHTPKSKNLGFHKGRKVCLHTLIKGAHEFLQGPVYLLNRYYTAAYHLIDLPEGRREDREFVFIISTRNVSLHDDFEKEFDKDFDIGDCEEVMHFAKHPDGGTIARCFLWDRPNFDFDKIFVPKIAKQQAKFFDKLVEYMTHEENWGDKVKQWKERNLTDPLYEEEKAPNIIKTPLPPEMRKYGYFSAPDGKSADLYPDVKKMYPDNGLLKEETEENDDWEFKEKSRMINDLR